jgi:hypothetical protein
MTPTVLLAIAVLLIAGALLFAVRLVARAGHGGRSFELGAVSTRWLSELRRDEPWTRS